MFLRKLLRALLILIIGLQWCFAQSAKDTKIPYTVGDRQTLLEIKLKLDAYQESTNAKLDAYQESINAKLDAHQKFMDAKLKAYQESTDAKLDGINSRLSFLESLMITMISIIIASIAGLGTYLIWTQKRERQLAQAQTKTEQPETITKAELESILKRIQEFQEQHKELI